MFRTAEPVGGTAVYDVPGTLQGLWFRVGEPAAPENPHLAFVFDNTDPSIRVICTGVSIPDLGTGMYSFDPAAAGTADREFSQVTADGKIYRYNLLQRCGRASLGAVLLVEMTSATTLRVERQPATAGPPWAFTANQVAFER